MALHRDNSSQSVCDPGDGSKLVRCSRCNKRGQFRRGSSCCKVCDKKLRHRDRLRISATVKRWQRANPERCWLVASLANHRRKGFIIDLPMPELLRRAKETKCCPLCGVKFLWKSRQPGRTCSLNVPTLDRTNNQRVLTLQTVQIICLLCNTTKGPRTMVQFRRYCRRIAGL